MENNKLVFKRNSIICMCGPTGVGKTFLLRKIIEERRQLFEDKPDFVLYCYSIWQPIYSEMKEEFGEEIMFQHGIPDTELLKRMSVLKPGLLLLLDDCLEKIIDKPVILTLFVEQVHHFSINLCYVLHNIYCSGKNRRTLTLQTQYFIFFPTRSDQLSFEIFASRLGKKNSKSFMEIYDDIKKHKFKYFIVDSHPRSESNIFVWTGIFNGQKMIAYEL